MTPSASLYALRARQAGEGLSRACRIWMHARLIVSTGSRRLRMYACVLSTRTQPSAPGAGVPQCGQVRRILRPHGRPGMADESPTAKGRRSVAILAADIAGYNRLIGEDEAATVRDLKGHQAANLPLMGTLRRAHHRHRQQRHRGRAPERGQRDRVRHRSLGRRLPAPVPTAPGGGRTSEPAAREPAR